MKNKFKKGDGVVLTIAGKILECMVETVDADGVFDDHSQPYYDIYCEEDGTLYKHFPESLLKQSSIYKNKKITER